MRLSRPIDGYVATKSISPPRIGFGTVGNNQQPARLVQLQYNSQSPVQWTNASVQFSLTSGKLNY